MYDIGQLLAGIEWLPAGISRLTALILMNRAIPSSHVPETFVDDDT